MAMSMGSSSMAMSMTSGTATASAHSMSNTAMSMSGMSGMSDSMDGSDMMSMNTMMMNFFTSTSTRLFSASWAPSSTGQYAGTCIFLIAFTVLFRAILSVRSNFGSILAAYQHRTQTAILRSDYDKTGNHVPCGTKRPWRIHEAVLRALLDTVLAGVAYLLMIAVMTMNVGYFMSVLGGTFLGSFIFGGQTAATAH